MKSLKTSITHKKNKDLITKIVILFFSLLAFFSLILLFSFLIKAAYPAYQKYGFFKMYFTANFTEKGNWGIWSPLLITLITSFLAIIIATPIALRGAYFIRYRLNRGKKTIRTIINILAGVPSVIFGIFALKSLQLFTNLFLGASSGNTILNSVFTLVIIIMPVLISLILNQLSILPQEIIDSSIALGNTKTYVMYTTVKKAIKPNIYVAVIVALGRAIGETMALSVILISNSPNPFKNGFGAFFQSDFGSLGVLIAKNMFTDQGRDPSPLFAAGLALFVIIMILVIVVTRISSQKRLINQNPLFDKPWTRLKTNAPQFAIWWVIFWHYFLMIFKLIRFITVWLFMQLYEFWKWSIYWLSYPFTFLFRPQKLKSESYSDYFIKFVQDKRSNISRYLRIGLEIISITLVLGVIAWIVLDLFIVGMPQYRLEDWSFTNEVPIIGNQTKRVPSLIFHPLVLTFVLIGLTIVIAFPFALASAIYLSEYARDKKIGKFLRFFLDSLGGTPSILFGIFGLIFFIETLGLHGKAPLSLIAGSLTMVLVIVPSFTRSIEQVLVKVPDQYRFGSYALGASKTKTIFRIIFPQAIIGIVSGVISSMGRVMSETAPVFLTLGLSSSIVDIGLFLPGATLTTNIFDIFINNRDALSFDQQINLSYKLGSVALLATSFFVLLANSVPFIGNKVRLLKHKNHQSLQMNSVKIKQSSKKLQDLSKRPKLSKAQEVKIGGS